MSDFIKARLEVQDRLIKTSRQISPSEALMEHFLTLIEALDLTIRTKGFEEEFPLGSPFEIEGNPYQVVGHRADILILMDKRDKNIVYMKIKER